MTPATTERLDTLGKALGDAALRTLVRLCETELRNADREKLDAVCAAMRAKSREAIDELLDDGKACPSMANLVFTSAVMTLVNAGIRELRG
ncbi:hypothetical protein [Accumulibacter sp.]|uniref:hypothetical protein n=1 Tax=Accumulibacter sp. TaxID=2053492 RepID=UPI0025E26F65|nr:hypothetical protein [Accumulibacter sp.]MCM8595167.1 hypothetical protein [Accumulibacter sp.]MCM8625614.1 hypothetical protein [Accumulibacter sp.]MDS4049313.1 hypothetical protein [Accumulibacter sp.]